MRGFVASSPPGKRRWKGFALAVIALVVFSLLVPLAFLLGLHNRFPYGTPGNLIICYSVKDSPAIFNSRSTSFLHGLLCGATKSG